MTNITREEVKTEEPPTITPQVTNVKSSNKVPKVKPEKVDIIREYKVETQSTTKIHSQIVGCNCNQVIDLPVIKSCSNIHKPCSCNTIFLGCSLVNFCCFLVYHHNGLVKYTCVVSGTSS